MNATLSSKVFLLLSTTLILAGCGKEVALEIPDLGISVLAEEGASVQKVSEGGFDVYRVSIDAKPVADLEVHEGYDFPIESVASVEGIQGVLDSWGFSYTVLNEVEGSYGAAVSYETPDAYGVLAGLKNGGTEVICQAPVFEDPDFSIQDVLEVCASMAPLQQ